MRSVDQSTLSWRVLWLLPYVPPAGPIPSATQALDPAELRSEGLLLSLEEQLGALTLSELQNSEPSSTVSLNGERFQVELFEDTRESTKVLFSCHLYFSRKTWPPHPLVQVGPAIWQQSYNDSILAGQILSPVLNSYFTSWIKLKFRRGFWGRDLGPPGIKEDLPWRITRNQANRVCAGDRARVRAVCFRKQPKLDPRAHMIRLSAERSDLLKGFHLRALSPTKSSVFIRPSFPRSLKLSKAEELCQRTAETGWDLSPAFCLKPVPNLNLSLQRHLKTTNQKGGHCQGIGVT